MRSVKLPAGWVEKAEVFELDARRHFEEGVYWLACFSTHQATEPIKQLVRTVEEVYYGR